MTPQEANKEFKAISKEIGPKSWVSVSLSFDRGISAGALYCSVYPQGVTGSCAFTVFAESFADLVVATRAKWEEHGVKYRQQRTRKMALAIIRITAEIGHCTDAALRQEFAGDEVTRYGADACTEADTMAGKGPFAIVSLGGANGAPADAVERGAEGAQVH